MRLLVTVSVLVLACAALLMAAEVCPPGATPATTAAGPAPSVIMATNDTFDYCFARSLGITCAQVTAYRSLGLSNSDITMAAAIAKKSAMAIGTVVAQYQLTPDWNTVLRYYKLSCDQLGLIPDLMNKDNNVYNAALISQMYGFPIADIKSLNSQGFSWGEVNMITNAAARTSQTLQQIASMRKNGTTWEAIATQFNVPLTRLTEPCPISAPRVAAASGAGPVCTKSVAPVMYNNAGNVMITQEEALRYYAMGNDWTSVAIAVNIARETGYPISQVLSDLRSGQTWEMVALTYGVPASKAFDVSCYPFPQRSIYSASMQAKNMERLARYQSSTSVAGPSPIMMPGVPSEGKSPVY